ncbi:hypothetical protein Veis_2030 [Verminephrobacter eiseniae EF01-2]|uniref:SMP-30/Gluconolactonase/LRE-like region domain-containing protein n=1 Tax=Verminephrobacter eiseniae (strain EF01-2) TaxID=391735 RepID=A1WJH4_VEREI|nr:hypothetical protein [Verminephrobacter eiseniae]ABM57781.1 hypothetical protein Veis_2030 [Verminephrobacter eiseniae EF01-2]
MSFLYSALDARFHRLVLPNAELECLYEGGRWLEGPLWLPDSGQLLFSDIPNDQVLRRVLVSRHRSSVGLRWPSKRIAALHRLPIQLGMGCAMRLALRSDGCAQPTTSDR